jgi:hypothetical protein
MEMCESDLQKFLDGKESEKSNLTHQILACYEAKNEIAVVELCKGRLLDGR